MKARQSLIVVGAVVVLRVSLVACKQLPIIESRPEPAVASPGAIAAAPTEAQARTQWQQPSPTDTLRPAETPVRAAATVPAPPPVPPIDQPTAAGPSWTVYRSLNEVRKLAFAPDGALWVAARNGVVRWDLTTGQHTDYVGGVDIAGLWTSDVAVAPDGTVWVATHAGVERFDGSVWRMFSTEDGIPGTIAQSLAIAPDGSVWAGTEIGIAHYDGEAWTGYTAADGLAGDGPIWSIDIAPNGDVWCTTHGAGISRYSPTDDRWETFSTDAGLPSPSPRVVAAGPGGDVLTYIAYQGLYRYDGQSWTRSYELPGQWVCDMAFDAEGVPWLATCNGLHTFGAGLLRLRGDTWTAPESQFPLSPDTTAIAFGPDGLIAAGDSVMGLAIYQEGDWRVLSAGPIAQAMTSVAITPDGVAWFGHGGPSYRDRGGGITRFDGSVWDYWDSTAELSGANVTALAIAPDGELWVGGGCNVIRRDGAAWKTLYGCQEHGGNVHQITFDGAGNAWVSTDWHVIRFSDEGQQVYENRVSSALAVAPDGALWLGYSSMVGGGVSRFDGRAWITYTAEFGGETVRALAVAPDGGVWAAVGEKDLRLFNGTSWVSVTKDSGTPAGPISKLAVAPDGSLWAAAGESLAYFAGDAWMIVDRGAGAVGQLNDIAFGPDGSLWLASSEGAARLRNWQLGLERIATRSTRGPMPRTPKATSAIPNTPAAPIPTPFPPPTQPPAPTTTTTTTTDREPFNLRGSLLIDGPHGRLYGEGLYGDQEKTLVFNAEDGSLLTAYDDAGPLALDVRRRRLYIDQDAAGIAVLDTAAGEHLATVPMPGSQAISERRAERNAQPQVEPSTGLLLAFRDATVFTVDPASGTYTNTRELDVPEMVGCSGPLPHAPPIEWSQYDPDRRILYLSFTTYACIPYIGQTVVAYDAYDWSELGRQGVSVYHAVASPGRLHGSSFYRLGIGYVWGWKDGHPWRTSSDWGGGSSPLAVDPSRNRLYQAMEYGLRVFDSESLDLLLVVPKPWPGTLAGFDPQTDQMYFYADGQLRAWPASAIHPPTPEPPLAMARPMAPLRQLLVSPDWPADATLAGLWDGGATSARDCFALGQSGGRLLLSEDGGRTWNWPLGGLRNACTEIAALAISPAYLRDHTLFVGVVGTGLFKSSDGGRLWQPAGAGLPSMGVSSIHLSPSYDRDQILFVRLLSGGLHRSRDGARSWASLGVDSGVMAVSAEFDEDRTLMGVVAPLDRPDLRELKLSRDEGDTWQALSPGLGGEDVKHLSLAPLFAKWGVAFAWTSEGALYRTADAGATWSEVLSTGRGSYVQIAYAPEPEGNRPVFLLVVDRDGTAEPAAWHGRLYRSGDGGLTWQQARDEAYDQITALAESPAFGRDAMLLFGTAGGDVLMQRDPWGE